MKNYENQGKHYGDIQTMKSEKPGTLQLGNHQTVLPPDFEKELVEHI